MEQLIKRFIWSLCISYWSISLSVGQDDERPTIVTPLGPVMGTYIKSYEGRTVTAFEGIPFAKPPVGELRFKEPQPIEPWTETLLTNTTYVCIHFLPILSSSGVSGEEDCLYIYVYVPLEKITGEENLDVVVHIHGGAFMLGAPKFFAGPDYMLDKDIIYVSFNYRLGVFGFISTEDEVLPGNFGLKDQVLALKWIKDNIKSFGGNPDSVTLTGLSAGGASVHYHYLSPMSRGLFHRGFSQSGTALNPWALTENPRSKALKLASKFNCNVEFSQEILDCLREKPANEIISAMRDFFIFLNAVPFVPFGPVIEKNIENPFLPDHPYKLLSDGKIYDVPWVTSNTKNEGIYPVGFFVLYRKIEEFNNRWNELIPFALEYYDTVTDDNEKCVLAERLREHYLDNATLTMDNINKLVDIFTDRFFLYNVETAVKMHANVSKSPVYYYFFDYQILMKTIFTGFLTGSAHSDDGRLFWKIVSNPKKFKETDQELKNIFTEFLFNYANKGSLVVKDVLWEPVEADSNVIKFLHVTSPSAIKMDSAEHLVDVNFWDSLPINENQHLFMQ